jgi:hypothetical protein
MNDDLIEKTEAMIKRHEEGYFDWLPIKQIMPELVAEIKRLREIQEVGPHAVSVGGKTFLSIDVDEKRLEQLAAKDALNNDLMANCNQLRDRCWKAESKLARWQKIAIKERSWLLLLETDILDLPLRENYANQTDKYHDRATKELNLQVTRESSYIDRLEAAFLDMWKISLNLQESDLTIEQQTDLNKKVNDLIQNHARAALTKIREGK